MFAKREPAALRTKLQGLSADRKLGRVSEDSFKYGWRNRVALPLPSSSPLIVVTAIR